MDILDTLPVRFHFGGDFVNDGNKKKYVGGREAMSYIDRDKLSLPEEAMSLKEFCCIGCFLKRDSRMACVCCLMIRLVNLCQTALLKEGLQKFLWRMLQ